ncbi:MAG: ATP-binding cassette domain-containing protein [Anaerotruncus sp.]|nr:ATP-binding cassette domain-containing protein [Anaerotruncus sp.]
MRQRLGIQLQETQLSEKLTRRGDRPAVPVASTAQGRRVDEVLAMVELEEKRRSRVGKLSGGQKQRLAVACALVSEPGPAVPRRADDRPRPAVAPPALGRCVERLPARGGTDRPDDALHGRGRDALRPRGDRRPRPGDRARHAARADRARSAPST